MRSRLLAALVAGVLAVPLLGQTVASAEPREVTGPSLPATASPTAAERASDALARAEALFAEKSPAAARRQAETTGREATLVLNELRKSVGDLSPGDRERAEALLARPWPDGDDLGDGIVVKYDNGEETPVCGATICIHYANGPDTDAPEQDDTTPFNGIPDEVDRALLEAEHVNSTYVAAGYRMPDRDNAIGGGTDKLDVYLADVGAIGLYGYCTSDQPLKNNGTSNYWAYCVIDDDFAGFPNAPEEDQQVTLAHEYFHAVQFAYDADEAGWFLEATATWAEDEVYDSVNDNWNYLPDGQMGEPRIPLNFFGGFVHYGNWIFFRYLTEKYRGEDGGIPHLVREMLQRTSNRTGEPDATAMQAIQNELRQRGTTLSRVYGQFAVANRNPRRHYDEGRNYRAATPAKTFRLSSSRRSTGRWETKVRHLSNWPFRYKPGRGTTARNWRLRLTVDLQPRNTVPSARVLVYKKSGRIAVSSIRLNRRTQGSAVLPFSSRSVRYVELVLVNAGPRSNKGLTRFNASIFRR